MKKRSGSKRKSRKQEFKNIKETLAFKLLIIFIIILFVLVVIWAFVYEPEVDDEGLEGELGTLKWDFDEDVVVFEVNYTIAEDNESILMDMNWTSGNESVGGFLINFVKPEGDCNITYPGSFFEFGISRTVAYYASSCSTGDYENVTDVNIYAQINVNLTQTTIPIPDITIYNDDSLINVVNLNDYFSSLVNISYGLVGTSDGLTKTGIFVNGTTDKISFVPLLARYGSYEFNLTASEDYTSSFEGEGDVLSVVTSGNNMSFNVTFVDSDRPIPNHAPDFHSNGVDDDYDCDDLLWNRNTNYTLNMTECWDDEDDDTLTLRHTNSNNDNVTIKESNDVLTLTPDTNWVGSGYFYIYANDSKTEEGKRIDFDVRVPPSTNSTTTTNTHPNIKTTSPSSSDVSLVNGNKTFTITAERYSTIKWYLNGALLSGSGLSLSLNDLEDGDIVKVEIINGTRVDSKTWNIKVGESIPQSGTTSLGLEVNLGKVIFYMIVVVLIIIILLIIWIFISEKRNKNKKVHLGFGVVGGGVVGKKTSSDQFNIPNR